MLKHCYTGYLLTRVETKLLTQGTCSLMLRPSYTGYLFTRVEIKLHRVPVHSCWDQVTQGTCSHVLRSSYTGYLFTRVEIKLHRVPVHSCWDQVAQGTCSLMLRVINVQMFEVRIERRVPLTELLWFWLLVMLCSLPMARLSCCNIGLLWNDNIYTCWSVNLQAHSAGVSNSKERTLLGTWQHASKWYSVEGQEHTRSN